MGKKRFTSHGPPSRMTDPSFHNLAPDAMLKVMRANGFKRKKTNPDVWRNDGHVFDLPNHMYCSYTHGDRHEEGDWSVMLEILKERPDFQRTKPKKNSSLTKQGHPAVLFDYGKWLAGDDRGLEKVLLSYGYKRRELKNTTPDKVIARYSKKGHSSIRVMSDGKYRLNNTPIKRDGKLHYEIKSYNEISRDDLVSFVKS